MKMTFDTKVESGPEYIMKYICADAGDREKWLKILNVD